MTTEKPIEEILEWQEENNQISFIDFELFKKIFGVKIIGLTLKCPKCSNKWGLSIWDEKSISNVSQDKLLCYECKRKDQNNKLAGQQETLPILGNIERTMTNENEKRERI